MRFFSIEFYANQVTGTDSLGNQESELVKIYTSKARYSPWTIEEIDVDGRDITKQNFKILTKAKLSAIEKATAVDISGSKHKIESVKDYGRWRCIVLKGKYRNEN